MVKILSAKLYVKSRIQNSFSNIINFHFRTKKNGIFEEKLFPQLFSYET